MERWQTGASGGGSTRAGESVGGGGEEPMGGTSGK